MSATIKPVAPPPRSPERAKLADAIFKRDASAGELERVTEALGRIDDDIFERLEAAIRQAREAVEDAMRAAPALLVARALGEPPDPDVPTVAEAEGALKDADQALLDARSARSILRDELRGREYAADQARRTVDSAVKAVVASDPAKLAVVREFFAAGRRALRLARIIQTFGDVVTGVSAAEVGLHFRIGDITQPGDIGRSMYRPEPAWAAALEALREDADAELPDLPAPEPDLEPAPAAAAA